MIPDNKGWLKPPPMGGRPYHYFDPDPARGLVADRSLCEAVIFQPGWPQPKEDGLPPFAVVHGPCVRCFRLWLERDPGIYIAGRV